MEPMEFVLEEIINPSVGEKKLESLNSQSGKFQDIDGDWADEFLVLDSPSVATNGNINIRDKRSQAGFFQRQEVYLAGFNPVCEQRNVSCNGSGDAGKRLREREFQATSSRANYQNSTSEVHSSHSEGSLYQERSLRSAESYCQTASVSSMDDIIAVCQLCNLSIPLMLAYPSQNCTCIFCEHCMKSYVEIQLEKIISTIEARGIKSALALSEHISCPGTSCDKFLSLLSYQGISPAMFARWEESMSQALFESDSDRFTSCPNCQAAIEKIETTVISDDDEGPANSTKGMLYADRDPDGNLISRQAEKHKERHLFRCAACKSEFCGSCASTPYHLGRTCEEHAANVEAGNCRYCEQSLTERKMSESDRKTISSAHLRKTLERSRADIGWCVEKTDLWDVLDLVESVCKSRSCQSLLEQACSKLLVCGHRCLGVRGESHCVPCLQDNCRENRNSYRRLASDLPSAQDFCPICQVEPLERMPCVQLSCSHIVHRECADLKVLNGYPGPEISFNFLKCPVCPVIMKHPSLNRIHASKLHLKIQVEEKAVERLKMDGLQGAVELKRGGAFEGRETEFAMFKYRFYECNRCKQPYFGGERQCEVPGDSAGGARRRKGITDSSVFRFLYNRSESAQKLPRAAEGVTAETLEKAKELICGGCSSREKGICLKGHGREYIQFKCRFCCSLATYFCFGKIHFCTACHQSRPDFHGSSGLSPCRGGKRCPLKIDKHPPNGEEFCLGCSLCRMEKC